ncbi:hypothetical protein SAMN02799622_02035 [Methylobacterium sp. UNC378MF]|uniref:hypothetical protein n=1 Tax=Methylobacterium sp. UNC378MF TaxID=1502748 RepID=UPI0008914DDD|nr:hypothetical protein [Methylobacterium sp. UNC378MF]SDA18456.1 hypothetical protein SAMN02799622_02035 [Methylobacterium sp. UNC378MF]
MAMPPLALKPARRRSVATLYASPRPVIETDEAVPGTVEAWEAIAPIRPDTAHVRAPRFLDLAGELLTATLIIAGGVFAYGFIPVA